MPRLPVNRRAPEAWLGATRRLAAWRPGDPATRRPGDPTALLRGDRAARVGTEVAEGASERA
ncbi:hypothetical protein BCD49_29605 [Pseudofrankia sp. EUN1h]|nr:hypothetical protein BCD49_29605 [Pseudofrankia sp. EUN1h]